MGMSYPVAFCPTIYIHIPYGIQNNNTAHTGRQEVIRRGLPALGGIQTGMTSDQYKEYLKSPEWRAKAAQRMSIDGFRCQCCNSTGTAQNPLQCHHITYRNLQNEDVMRDLVTLCKSCHKGVHRIMYRITGYDQNGTPRRGWKDALPNLMSWTINITGENETYFDEGTSQT